MLHLTQRLPGSAAVLVVIDRWQRFSRSPLGVRLIPFYVALAGAAIGVLVADQLVRSMWEHAIFTGRNQWRTVALLLTFFWIAIGAVTATALLGPPESNVAGATAETGAGSTDP